MAVRTQPLPRSALTPRNTNYLFGAKLTVEGKASDSIVLELDEDVTQVDVEATGATANDIDLTTAGVIHNQELMITLTKKPSTSTVTISEGASTTITQLDGGEVVKVTLDAVGEYCLLRFEVDGWRIIKTTGTIDDGQE